MPVWNLVLAASLIACHAVTAAPAAVSGSAGGQSAVSSPIAEADRAFCRAVAARDIEAFARLIAEDAVFHGRTGVVRGRAAVVKAWSGLFDPNGTSTLTWEPDDAEIAASGDLGYTMGSAVSKGIGPVERRTRYVTIWRRQAGGTWQVVVDIGSDDGPQR